MTGAIKAIRPDKGFGFISHPQGGPDVFFHCSNLDPSLTFDEQLVERLVEYEVQESAKGLRAIDVRAAS